MACPFVESRRACAVLCIYGSSDLSQNTEPTYLTPYLRAAERHGAEFQALLWASPGTQAARFDAFARLVDMEGKSLLDVGSGRADLLDFLLARKVRPESYVGIEAIPQLAEAAEAKRHARCTILRADFVREPVRMFVGADVVLFSGSLNTVDRKTFYRMLRLAFDASAGTLVFNFLCSPLLAGTEYLTWHRLEDVLAFAAKELSPHVRHLADYLPGDCTIAVDKADGAS